MNIQQKIDRLNAIQAEWMALDFNAPKKEQKRVCDLMDSTPRAYVSMHDINHACGMVDGMPTNAPMPLADVLKYHGHLLDQEVAWSNGKWIELPEVSL